MNRLKIGIYPEHVQCLFGYEGMNGIRPYFCDMRRKNNP